MNRLQEILQHNARFVEKKEYEQYATDKYPNKKMVILTCMDTRLVELLPKAMNIKNGDAKVVKTAGALIHSPYDSVMRSILVAIGLLKAEEVFVVGHHDCGMVGVTSEKVITSLEQKGVLTEKADQLKQQGVDVDNWLSGCTSVEEGVKASVELIQNHPLLPSGVRVHGLVIDPHTGKLDVVVDGTK